MRVDTGPLECARASHGRLCNGLYDLTATLLTLAFLALLREPGAEGAGRDAPWALARVPSGSQLGLDTSRRTSYRHHGGATSGSCSGSLRIHGETNTGRTAAVAHMATVRLVRQPRTTNLPNHIK